MEGFITANIEFLQALARSGFDNSLQHSIRTMPEKVFSEADPGLSPASRR